MSEERVRGTGGAGPSAARVSATGKGLWCLCTSEEYVDDLDRAAELTGHLSAGRDPHHTGSAPIAVELARVVESGDAGEAVYRHERVVRREAWRWLPAECLVDAARAYLQVGDLAGAGRLLVDADGIAPAEVRWRPAARTVVAGVTRGGPAGAGVARLATLVGLTG